jgi:hypothetical protein
MKKVFGVLFIAASLSQLTACAYSGAAAAGDKVVVLRNDAFLFGILRKAFVCKVSDAGLTACASSDNPLEPWGDPRSLRSTRGGG